MGRYILEVRIGSGGYGEVWKAHDIRNPLLWVAIKFLRADACCAEYRDRFASEIKSLEAVAPHPNIVAVYEHGEEGGLPFFVMEFIDGISLHDWLDEYRNRGCYPPFRVVCDIYIQICIAMQRSHEKNIIHRDLKPENIMLTLRSDGTWHVKLVDFGVARLGDRHQTRTGQPVGTVGHMAPEQWQGQQGKVGPVSDVFALGILLIEMLTLRKKSAQVLYKRMSTGLQQGAPGDFTRRQRQDIPFALWDVPARALHKDIEQRYENAQELLQDFRLAVSTWVPVPTPSWSGTPLSEQTTLRRVRTLPARTPELSVQPPTLRILQQPGLGRRMWQAVLTAATALRAPNRRHEAVTVKRIRKLSSRD